MGIRVRVPRSAWLSRFVVSGFGRFVLLSAALLFSTFALVGGYYWFKYSKLIDEKLGKGPFDNTAMLFAAPEVLTEGDPLTREELVAMLRRRGYTETSKNRQGWYHLRSDCVEIFPGPEAQGDVEPGVVCIAGGKIGEIISVRDNTRRSQFFVEPELITNLFDKNRAKRRMVRCTAAPDRVCPEIPKALEDAILSAEDKRFREHVGFDPVRILRTAIDDLREGSMRKGASTLTMQVARTFFLNRERSWKRKLAEVFIAMELERRLEKHEIFQHYLNYVDLGWRRSFAVQGYAESAQVHFGKDIRELTLPEAAMLAGMTQGPNLYNPFRDAKRSAQRRNVILGLMRENQLITEAEYNSAAASPVVLREGGLETSDAPYFVDLAYSFLQDQFAEHDFQANSYRIMTSLDMRLQREAVEAVRLGMKEVDDLLAKRKKKYPQAQVALVALDPKTAEIKALVGGRDYGQSQLNRTIARRQPGSAFKPFVYATILAQGLNGGENVVTPLTKVVDKPTVFEFDGRTYEPGNFGDKFYGEVNLRYAFSRSLNIPTVMFAEMAGYQEVVETARRAGMNKDIKPTPAVALGAYEVTPLEIAGAYTVFSNQGRFVKPAWLREIRGETGGLIYREKPVTRDDALNPAVSHMVVSIMEEVLRSGTGAGVRARGFTEPAAGKTGTSRDAWFAGFTSKLLCVVWVGFDGNQELPLEGGKAALPIWTHFMKAAHSHRPYRNPAPFEPPDGIVTVDVDPATNRIAAANCPNARTEVFLSGTQPQDLCPLHGGGARTMIAGWDEPEKRTEEPPASADTPRPLRRRRPAAAPAEPAPAAQPAPAQKRGWLDRIRGIFK